METPSPLKIINVKAIRSTEVVTENADILQALNLKLQVKVNNLEVEVDRLKSKSQTYDSLSKDLASLRKQLDKTAVALLKKCEAYDELKKEMQRMSSHQQNSPTGIATPIRQPLKRTIPVSSILRRKPPGIATDYSSDEEGPYQKRHGRPSMGSCGSLVKQIASEEGMPSHLRTSSGGPSTQLRNQVLLKLHTLKSASTESLESAGRKSIRIEEKYGQPRAPIKPKPKPSASIVAPQPPVPAKRARPGPLITVRTPEVTPSTSTQSAKALAGLTGKTTPKKLPVRSALGNSNGQRMVKMSLASVKRSNSNCSTKSSVSTTSTSSKPAAFRI